MGAPASCPLQQLMHKSCISPVIQMWWCDVHICGCSFCYGLFLFVDAPSSQACSTASSPQWTAACDHCSCSAREPAGSLASSIVAEPPPPNPSLSENMETELLLCGYHGWGCAPLPALSLNPNYLGARSRSEDSTGQYFARFMHKNHG